MLSAIRRGAVVAALAGTVLAGTVLAGTVLAGTVLAGTGAAWSAAASAGPPVPAQPRVTGPTTYTNHWAGYTTGGAWRFRYVAASVKVAACQATAASNAPFTMYLTGDRGYFAAMVLTCGGGTGAVTFHDAQFALGTLLMTPAVGDTLKLSIYRDVADETDYFSATNTRTGRVQTVAVSTSSAVVYRHTEIDAYIADNSQVTPPQADTVLWQVSNVAVTSYDGRRGSLNGPWTTFKLVDTSTGDAAGTVVMSPSGLSNGGKNFGIWLRS